MTKLRRSRNQALFAALAIAAAVGSLRAQDYVNGPYELPSLIDGNLATTLALAHAAPEYPAVARLNFVQGRVDLELVVDQNGHVTRAHVLKGNPVLAVSGLEAVRRWTYRPLVTAGQAVAFLTTVELKFVIPRRGLFGLSPQKAEQDFLHHVEGPEVRRPAEAARGTEIIHMRLLLDEHGEVVDRQAPAMTKERLVAVCESLRDWTFRPAHWGSLPVASYVDVDVPVSGPSVIENNTASIGAR